MSNNNLEGKPTFKTADDVLAFYRLNTKNEALKGLIHIDNYGKVVTDLCLVTAKSLNLKNPNLAALMQMVYEPLASLQWWKGTWTTQVNRATGEMTRTPTLATPPSGLMVGEKLEKLLADRMVDYYYQPTKVITHPDPVKFAKTCLRLFPVAKNVAQFAESIRRVISNAIAEAGGDAKYTNTMGWLFSLQSGRCGKSKFLDSLIKTLNEKFGMNAHSLAYSGQWVNPLDYKTQLNVWTEMGELWEGEKGRLNLFIDHDSVGYNVKYGGAGTFRPRGSFVASSNFLPPGILKNPERYRAAEWYAFSYNERPADMMKYWPTDEEYDSLVFDLVDSCPLSKCSSAKVETDVYRQADLEKYMSEMSLFTGEDFERTKYQVEDQYKGIVADIVEYIKDKQLINASFGNERMRVAQFWKDWQGEGRERKNRIEATLAFLNRLQSNGSNIISRGTMRDNVRRFNIQAILDKLDLSYLGDAEVEKEVSEVTVRAQWEALVGLTIQKYGNNPNTPNTPPTGPRKEEVDDTEAELVRAEMATEEPSEGVSEGVSEVNKEEMNNYLDTTSSESPADEADMIDEYNWNNVEDYKDANMMSALIEQYGLMPCADRMSQPTDRIEEARQEFVVAGECVNAEAVKDLGNGRHAYSRKQADCRPTAFVYEADGASLEEQRANLKPEMKRHALWAVFSGKKSIHVVVPIPEEYRTRLADKELYKAVWSEVAKEFFYKSEILDTACASICRMSRMPWAKRSDNGVVQALEWVNTNVTPMPFFGTLVAKAEDDVAANRVKRSIQAAVSTHTQARYAHYEGKGENTYDDQLKHLEASEKKASTEPKRNALEALKSGVVPAGQDMISTLRMLKSKGMEKLAVEYYRLAHEQHPTNLGQAYEYYN